MRRRPRSGWGPPVEVATDSGNRPLSWRVRQGRPVYERCRRDRPALLQPLTWRRLHWWRSASGRLMLEHATARGDAAGIGILCLASALVWLRIAGGRWFVMHDYTPFHWLG